jgi:hypothetical protein
MKIETPATNTPKPKGGQATPKIARGSLSIKTPAAPTPRRA